MTGIRIRFIFSQVLDEVMRITRFAFNVHDQGGRLTAEKEKRDAFMQLYPALHYRTGKMRHVYIALISSNEPLHKK